MDQLGEVRTREQIRRKPLGVIKCGTVEGHQVDDILIDTGCSRKNIPDKKILPGEAIVIRCAHGNTVLYPIAQVEVEVAGRTIMVEAAVLTTLPTAVLLGTDVPELPEILKDDLTRKEIETKVMEMGDTAAMKKQGTAAVKEMVTIDSTAKKETATAKEERAAAAVKERAAAAVKKGVAGSRKDGSSNGDGSSR